MRRDVSEPNLPWRGRTVIVQRAFPQIEKIVTRRALIV
jgi:hypothetical protein